MAKWIKVPGFNQFRGEGEWRKVHEEHPDKLADYEYCKRTGLLPTAEQDEKPTT